MKSTSNTTHLLGVDTGGTFTDFVYYDGQKLLVHKVLSTPEAPEQAILQGIAEMLIALDNVAIVHGSTVATNAVLQNRGVKTVYITNQGFADLLTIGRQARRELFDLQPAQPPIAVPAALCLEIDGRVNAAGEELQPLTDPALRSLCQSIEQIQPQAIAINLLFSYVNDEQEKLIEKALRKYLTASLANQIFISRSSEILPEYREYERGIATWLNACTGPLVQRYLTKLQESVPNAPVSVMQSSGGTVGIEQAGKHAVQMLLSGPAGGLAGAQFVAASDNIDQIMTFDMGGTSSDVALIDKTINLTTAGQIADWPVAVPMVDMHTIGAGGGSIAKVDAGGLLQVGPESAGSKPGPACYGNNSLLATVTDANLVLGRILPDAFLGGHLSLDLQAAQQAVQKIADELNTDLDSAAEGIVRIANEHMSAALRVISIQRGIDPRNFTLVSFGGAGGLHVCALAEALQMSNVLVPIYAGVLSALGMLVAPRSRLLSQTVNMFTHAPSVSNQINELFRQLAVIAERELTSEGLLAQDLTSNLLVDLRYRGQSSHLSLGWNKEHDHKLEQLNASFHERHQQRFGHRLDEDIEIVNVRLQMFGPTTTMNLAKTNRVFLHDFTPEQNTGNNRTISDELDRNVHIINRVDLKAGAEIDGPALIVEPVATTYIEAGWRCQCQSSGNLLLDHEAKT